MLTVVRPVELVVTAGDILKRSLLIYQVCKSATQSQFHQLTFLQAQSQQSIVTLLLQISQPHPAYQPAMMKRVAKQKVKQKPQKNNPAPCFAGETGLAPFFYCTIALHASHA